MTEEIRPSRFSGEKIPDAIKIGIGDLIVSWAYIEFQLGVIARVGFGLPPRAGFAVIFGSGLRPLFRSLNILAANEEWVWDPELRQEIGALVSAAVKQKDQRHAFAHGVFGFERGKLLRFRFDDLKQKRQKVPTEPVTEEELRGLVLIARNLGNQAQALTVRLKRWRRLHAPRRPR